MAMYDPLEDDQLGQPPASVPPGDPRAGLYAYLAQQAANRAQGQTVPSYQQLQNQGHDNAQAAARNAFAAQLQNSASMAGTLNGKRSETGGTAELAKSLDAASNEDLNGGYQALAQRNRDVATEGAIYKDLSNPDIARARLYASLAGRADAQKKADDAEAGRNTRNNNNIASHEKIAKDANDVARQRADSYDDSVNKPPGKSKNGFIQFLPDVKGPNGEPMMINPDTGQAEIVNLPPGFTKTPKGGTEKDTKAQFEVGGYARRLDQAEQVFKELGSEGYNRGDTMNAAKNKVMPEAWQDDGYKRNEQAERNFVNSVLRRESGAAIAASEFESAEKQYFPRPGDSPALIAQKAANRQQVINSFKAEAKGAYDKIPGVDVPKPDRGGASESYGPTKNANLYDKNLRKNRPPIEQMSDEEVQAELRERMGNK